MARTDVRVLPEHRRRGAGTALVEAAERMARAAGRTELGGMDEIPTRDGYADTAGPFARRLGFSAALRLVRRRLDVPLDAVHAAALRRTPRGPRPPATRC